MGVEMIGRLFVDRAAERHRVGIAAGVHGVTRLGEPLGRSRLGPLPIGPRLPDFALVPEVGRRYWEAGEARDGLGGESFGLVVSTPLAALDREHPTFRPLGAQLPGAVGGTHRLERVARHEPAGPGDLGLVLAGGLDRLAPAEVFRGDRPMGLVANQAPRP